VGRPKREETPVIVNIKLTLYPSTDEDLIQWFESIAPRRKASAVIAALRSGTMVVAEADALVDDEEVADGLEALLL
jgi:hypothetical protein